MLTRNEKIFWLVILLILTIEFSFRIFYLIEFRHSLEDAYMHPELPGIGSTVSLGMIVRPSPYENIIYELKPGIDVNYMYVPVRTNSQGWRDFEFSGLKNNDTIRIVGIGDSFMFGWSVDESKRYMDVLEDKLNSEYPEKRWETYVFAVPGYSLPNSLDVLRNYGLKYEPDMIIYGQVGNDMCLPNFIFEKKNLFSRGSFIILYMKRFISTDFRFYDIDSRGFDISKICITSEVPSEYKHLVGEKAFMDSLSDLNEIAKDIPTIVVLHHDLGEKLKIHENLFYFNSSLNTSDLKYIIGRDDSHPSALGHKMIADQIFEQLKSTANIDVMLKK
jgi:hypothetical protein